MYVSDNDFLYPELMQAHRALDAAVEAVYGVNLNGDGEGIVAHLFKLYAEKTDAGQDVAHLSPDERGANLCPARLRHQPPSYRL